MRKRLLFILQTALFSVVALLFHCEAYAADTTETFDLGASNAEFYLGLDGIGLDRTETAVWSEFLVGYGLMERFSAYAGVALESNGYFADGSGGLYMGLFGTPVDTDHFDLDLFLDVSGSGEGLGDMQIAPMTELNFDLDPQMNSWGAYLRVGVPIYGNDSGGDESYYHFEGTLGTYLTVAEGHQLLAEYDMNLRPKPLEERESEVGGIAVGYNAVLNDSIELINQVFFDLPQSDEQFCWGLMIGLIATMPAGGK